MTIIHDTKYIDFIDDDVLFDKNNIVTDHNMLDKNLNFSEAGLYSKSKFGKISDNENYSCECGAVQGYTHIGLRCVNCKSVVVDQDYFKKYSYIYLEDIYLIKPLLFNALKHIMPIVDILSKNTNRDNITKAEYKAIGFDKFKSNFKEVLEYYYKKNIKKPKTKDYYDFLINYEKFIFTNKIFVFSIGLRPALLRDGKLSFDDSSKYYNLIISNFNSIKSSMNKDINHVDFMYNTLIFEMQTYYNELTNYIFTKISGKDGILRNHLLGYRVNFSSRSVITPGTLGHKIDELHIPYITFIEFHKYKLINHLVRKMNYDYISAQRYIEDALLEFNEDLYNIIINEFINKMDIRCLLNRNPTISIGSIFQLKITGVHRDIDDTTITIHNNLLNILAGDFDGDVLNLILLIDQKFIDFTEPFAPKYFILNKDDGEFDPNISCDRDAIVGLRNFLLSSYSY